MDELAINTPRNHNRFAPIALFYGLQQESLMLAANVNCIPNASSYQTMGTLLDCAPNFAYLSQVSYTLRYKNLKYVQEIYKLIDAFIPLLPKSHGRKHKCSSSFWHFFGAASLEDVRILQENLINLQMATEI